MNFWNSTYSTSFLTNGVCRHWDSLFQLCAGVGGRSFLTIARQKTFFLCYYHYSRCETWLDSSLRWKINSTCFGENNHGTWQLVEASAFREAERWQTRGSSEEVTIGQSVRSHAFTKHLCECSALSGGVGGGEESAGIMAFELQEYTVYLKRLGRFQLSIWEPQRGIHQTPDALVLTVSPGVMQCGPQRFLRPWRTARCWLANYVLNTVAAHGYEFAFGGWWKCSRTSRWTDAQLCRYTKKTLNCSLSKSLLYDIWILSQENYCFLKYSTSSTRLNYSKFVIYSELVQIDKGGGAD